MKKTNQKGFTLAELLIVVAIIAVLVAIAIPVFSNQLEKARIAADKANVRSWYGEQVAAYLGESKAWPTGENAYNGAALQAQGAKVVCTTDSNDKNIWTVTYTATKLTGSYSLSSGGGSTSGNGSTEPTTEPEIGG